VERPLTAEEYDTLRRKMFRGGRITFFSIKKILAMGESDSLKLQSATRDHLLGDVTASILGKRGLFGPQWHEFPLFQQNEIVEHILAANDSEELANWLCENWGLEKAAAEQVVQASLPEGYGRLGKRALNKLVTIMERERVNYAEATLRTNYSHFRKKPKVLVNRLPYYGASFPHLVCGSDDPSDEDTIRYGRLSNPTVHIGLNQLRLLINTLIDNGERPSEIVIEVARDLKLSFSEKQKLSLNQAINRQKTLSRVTILNSLGLPNNGENRLRLRLWEELNPEDSNERYCVYSNEKITLKKLFSPIIEIDHILPFSRTLDNSVSNKTVCTRSANRAKGEYSPFEAFGHLQHEWEQINFRAQNFPRSRSYH
jgi:CRISPR-associated endonuclease Csn1